MEDYKELYEKAKVIIETGEEIQKIQRERISVLEELCNLKDQRIGILNQLIDLYKGRKEEET